MKLYLSIFIGLKKMSGSLHDKDICENILCKIAIIMLESEEIDKKFGLKEAWY